MLAPYDSDCVIFYGVDAVNELSQPQIIAFTSQPCRDHTSPSRRVRRTVTFQPLGRQPQPATVPPQQAQPDLPPVGENEEAALQDLAIQHRLHVGRQTVEASSQIHGRHLASYRIPGPRRGNSPPPSEIEEN
jgi:hypothetical protein